MWIQCEKKSSGKLKRAMYRWGRLWSDSSEVHSPKLRDGGR